MKRPTRASSCCCGVSSGNCPSTSRCIPGASSPNCTVRLTAKGQSQRFVWKGNGPVNALDHAVRNALLPAYPSVGKFELIDYKVRILDQGHGTDATVRVLIETTDGLSAWTTVGVGQNIVEASWEALSDAYLYGLIHAEEDVAVEVGAMSLDRG